MLRVINKLKDEVKQIQSSLDYDVLNKYDDYIEQLEDPDRFMDVFEDKLKRFDVETSILLSVIKKENFNEFLKFIRTYKKNILRCMKFYKIIPNTMWLLEYISMEELQELNEKVAYNIKRLNSDEELPIPKYASADEDDEQSLISIIVDGCLSKENHDILFKSKNKRELKKIKTRIYKIVRTLINEYTSTETINAVKMFLILNSYFGNVEDINKLLHLCSNVNGDLEKVADTIALVSDVYLEEEDYLRGRLIILCQLESGKEAVYKMHFKEKEDTIAIYKELIEMFSKIQEDDFISSNMYNLDLIKDENIKQIVADHIKRHNELLLDRKKELNQSHPINHLDSYDKLALKYKLEYTFTNDIKNSDISTQKIEMILDFLASKKITFSKRSLLEYVLLNSSKNKIKFVYNFLCSVTNYLSFLEDNITILGEDFDEFAANARLLEQFSIRSLDLDTYVIDNSILANNLKTLEQYSLPACYEFLANPNAPKYLDAYIELGLKDFIINNLEYCGINNDVLIKRLYIAKSLNMELLEGNRIARNIEYDFFIADEDLDTFIINDTNLCISDSCLKALNGNSIVNISKDEYFKAFEYKFRVSDFEYNIGNIIISRQKVIRNYAKLRTISNENSSALLFIAIIYESTLNMEQINLIASLFYDYGTNLILK